MRDPGIPPRLPMVLQRLKPHPVDEWRSDVPKVGPATPDAVMGYGNMLRIQQPTNG